MLNRGLHQLRYELVSFVRDPAAIFFTVALPVLMFFFLVSIIGPATVDLRNGISAATYYLPFVLTLGVVASAFFNTAVQVTTLRELGVLKRLRSTPASPQGMVLAWFGTSLITSLLIVVALVLLARLAYGISIGAGKLPLVFLALVLASASFTALGFAITRLIPSEAAALPLANAVVLPLYLCSGLLIPTEEAPAWVQGIGEVFPIRNLAEILLGTIAPHKGGSAWVHLLVLLAWGIAGLVLAARFFRWTPAREQAPVR
jgi:ABC-2 type transport system permease protein